MPAVGPAAGTSHWHAAYVVRICDDVLAPFANQDGPLGIHSHGDGVIHIHPFAAEAGFEGARFTVFADAIGLSLDAGELTLPGGGTWRDGDLCNGVPGRVYLDRWAAPDLSTTPQRIFDNFDDVRFVADGEMYQIAFAPADAVAVVPPSSSSLTDVSPRLAQPVPEPWVRIPDEPDPATAAIWPVDRVVAAPCEPDFVELRPTSGEGACYSPAGERLAATDAVVGARAVTFNRLPAVELTITPALRQIIVGHFAAAPAASPAMTLALEVDGLVVTAPLLPRLPASTDRLIVSGGLTRTTAERLAAAFSSEPG